MARLEGARELSRALSRLGAAAGGKALRSAVTQAMLPVVQEARRRIPESDDDFLHKTYKGRKVSSGFAKRSIRRRSTISRDKTRATAMVGVLPEAYYAVTHVELGTSKQAAQPWLRPSFRAKRRDVLRRLLERLRKNILKAGGRV